MFIIFPSFPEANFHKTHMRLKSLLHVIRSVLAAFCGIQSNKKFNEDDDYIQENGVSSYMENASILTGYLLIKFMFKKILGMISKTLT